MAKERDDLVYLAKLAEQAERFDEMVPRGVPRIAELSGAGGGGNLPGGRRRVAPLRSST